jgi:hypothetical protein
MNRKDRRKVKQTRQIRAGIVFARTAREEDIPFKRMRQFCTTPLEREAFDFEVAQEKKRQQRRDTRKMQPILANMAKAWRGQLDSMLSQGGPIMNPFVSPDDPDIQPGQIVYWNEWATPRVDSHLEVVFEKDHPLGHETIVKDTDGQLSWWMTPRTDGSESKQYGGLSHDDLLIIDDGDRAEQPPVHPNCRSMPLRHRIPAWEPRDPDACEAYKTHIAGPGCWECGLYVWQHTHILYENQPNGRHWHRWLSQEEADARRESFEYPH